MTTVAIGQHHREEGRMQIIKILIAQGIRIESKNTKGWTALITASFCGAVDVLLLLLANGADVDAKADDGLTATIVAAQVGLPYLYLISVSVLLLYDLRNSNFILMSCHYN
jgi:ankyrin repeat protein